MKFLKKSLFIPARLVFKLDWEINQIDSLNTEQKALVEEIEADAKRAEKYKKALEVWSKTEFIAAKLVWQNREEIEKVLNETQENQSFIEALEAEKELDERNTQIIEKNKLATIDELTQVSNRRAFDEDSNIEFALSNREKKPLSEMVIDIDKFKNVNDTYGHNNWDIILQEVAWRIKEVLKRPGDKLYRYGGEEFTVLLPNTEATGAKLVAESIREVIAEKPFAIKHNNEEIEIDITISIGLETNADNHKHESPQALFKKADEYLYIAKENWRNQVIDSKARDKIIVDDISEPLENKDEIKQNVA